MEAPLEPPAHRGPEDGSPPPVRTPRAPLPQVVLTAVCVAILLGTLVLTAALSMHAGADHGGSASDRGSIPAAVATA
jgi:hypothetical protein